MKIGYKYEIVRLGKNSYFSIDIHTWWQELYGENFETKYILNKWKKRPVIHHIKKSYATKKVHA
jgi:hypothetical protein